MIHLEKSEEKEDEMLIWIQLSQECIQQCLDVSKPIQESEIDSKLPINASIPKNIVPAVPDLIRLLQQNIR